MSSSILLPVTGTTPAAAGTAVLGSAVTGIDSFRQVVVAAHMTAPTGGDLDLVVQTQFGDSDWYDAASFPTIEPGDDPVVYAVTLSRSLSFIIPIRVGTNLSPALTDWGLSVLGVFGDNLRVIATAGAGTTAGAVTTVNFFGLFPAGL